MTNTKTEIERLVRAVLDCCLLSEVDLGGFPEDKAERLARVILQALREPSEGMIEAGAKAYCKRQGWNDVDCDSCVDEAAWTFPAMIDHILQERPDDSDR